MAYSNNIYSVRDLCLKGNKDGPENQKPFQGEIDYDYIMWIDSDSVFKPQQFKILLDQMEEDKNYSILAGIYPLEDNVRYATHFLQTDPQKRQYLTPAHVKKGLGTKPFKVWYTGMGFMLVRQGVFESLAYPWFAPMWFQDPGRPKKLVGDDTSFCLRAGEAGFATWVDPKVMIGHEKPVILR